MTDPLSRRTALAIVIGAGVIGTRLPSMPSSVESALPSRRRTGVPALVILALVSMLAACGVGGVTGAGPTRQENRDLDPFTRVEVGNGIGLTVQVGGAQAVEVEAQENILALITTTVEGGVLKITGASSFTTSTGVLVTATLPAFEGLSATGGSRAQIDALAGDPLDVELAGGARLVATGQATDVTLTSSGGAAADLGGLLAERMRVDLSGGSTATLNVSEEVSGSASGGAVATVMGGANVEVETSGGARITDN